MPRPSDGREVRTDTGLAIINPYGGIWTNDIFATPEAALAYLKKFWGNSEADLKRFKLATAIKTITIYRPEGDPVFVPLPVDNV